MKKKHTQQANNDKINENQANKNRIPPETLKSEQPCQEMWFFPFFILDRNHNFISESIDSLESKEIEKNSPLRSFPSNSFPLFLSFLL